MNTQKPHIKSKNRTASWRDAWKDNDQDMLKNNGDNALFESFGEYVKGLNDLEEVMKDASLSETDKAVKSMISDYRGSSSRHSEAEKFIRDIFTSADKDHKIADEVRKIKLEVNEKQINELTAEWVKEWHEKKQKGAGKDEKTKEIKNFITSSLEAEPDDSKPDTVQVAARNIEKSSRTSIVRYISLSAAAVLAVFMLIRTLLPSSDPDKLYNSFYEPFKIMSLVTRGAANEQNSYSGAVERYKLGQYDIAAIGFADAIRGDTSLIAPRFFLGVTQMALGNLNQAVNILDNISEHGGEYSKDAKWYLGLAYLKTGKPEKAAGCFEYLAKSPGFYSERAEKILRRLK
jgi:TolA-binding protein